MRPLFLAASTLALMACSAPALADDTPMIAVPADMAAQAQAVFDPIAAQYPALNVTVMHGSDIIWEAEGGIQRDARDGVTRDYNAYSVAKTITGMAFARLVDHDGFDLDQSVRAIDPALPAHYDAVTVRQLLSHTAGVRHYTGEADWLGFNALRCATPAEALSHFIADPLVREPGTGYGYTTYGFVLASHLLVLITDEASFDAALEAVLGEHYRARADQEDADKAVTWYGEDGAWQALPLSAECKFGGGGLLMSSRDLAAMGASLAAGEIVPVERMETLFEPRAHEDAQGFAYVYGMGTDIDPDFGVRFVAHSGGSPGGRSFLFVLVEPQLTIAVTGNLDGPGLDQVAIPLAGVFAGGD